MCGIVGYAGWERAAITAAADLASMCTAIRHRGPDEEGHYISSGVALGMRRLSVIDLAGGSQPISNEDGTVHVVFNGEIYNHRALRSRLAARHSLPSGTDTEVLVHLYEERAQDLVFDLRGMFAFAIWDDKSARLTLARDRLGIKPLYYWPTHDGVAFASELGAFRALEEFPQEIDASAVQEYLAFGYVPDPACIFRGVRKLPPGHLLIWDRDSGLNVRQYWSPVRPELAIRDEREAIAELQRLLSDAVDCHLEADVPLGAFLSGGIDSSTVVAQMRRLTQAPVRTFSIGFEEAEFDETPHAASVAKALGTLHTELIVRPEADRLIDDVVRVFDEPFADSSALPTMIVSELAREHVTVSLSGDGGDELFGGYRRYALQEMARDKPPAFVRFLARTVGGSLPHSAYGRNRLLNVARTRRGRYAATVAQALAIAEGGVVESVPEEMDLDHILDRWFALTADRDFVSQMTLVDLSSYLPGDILTKVDRASMAFSLEARVPLLDHPLVEFAVSLPGALKRRNGTGKWILREAVKGLIPESVLDQPKRGFALPLRSWFRGEIGYRLDLLIRADRPVYRYVDRSSVIRLVREHRGRRRDHSQMLWRVLVLDLWLEDLRHAKSTT